MHKFSIRIEFKAENETKLSFEAFARGFKVVNEKSVSFEVFARGIRWAIEEAIKEIKTEWPLCIERVDYFITEIKLEK
jgi:hypothetical protein